MFLVAFDPLLSKILDLVDESVHDIDNETVAQDVHSNANGGVNRVLWGKKS